MSRAVQLEVVGGDKAPSEPPCDVVEHRRGKAHVRIRGDAGRLEARIQQLVDENLERHTVLEAEGDRKSQSVHDAGKRGTLFGHLDEDLAGPTVFVHADGDVPFVAADAELVGNRRAFYGHLLALRT